MIEHETLSQLIDPATDDYRVSIYIPTHRAGVTELKQDKTRFKNCLDTAEADLRHLGVREKERNAQLEPGHELLRDEPFWRHQNHGLAVFIAPDSTRWYTLPEPVPEITITAHKYHLKPLLFLPESHQTFYILALSPASVRLLKADRETAEVMNTNVPRDITETRARREREPTQQHTVAGGGGRGRAVYHGHGGLKDYKHIELKKFVRAIAKAVDRQLRGSKAPLVFAGDDQLMGMYQSTARKTNLVAEYLHGNHDDMDAQTLHVTALPLVERFFRDNPSPVLGAYHHMRAHEPERVSTDLATITQAAGEGKIAELLLAADTTVWGNVSLDYSLETLPSRTAGAVDVLDVTATETYRHGGNVHETAPDDMPDEAVAAAILRH